LPGQFSKTTRPSLKDSYINPKRDKANDDSPEKDFSWGLHRDDILYAEIMIDTAADTLTMNSDGPYTPSSIELLDGDLLAV